MYLKSLEAEGFKSFAKKSSLLFGSPISAIVGPNGSGKSNIAEAFRFVLGEQSIKSMRGKRGEDLIFNGSKTVPRANRAAVKLVFDNTKKLLPVDFDEVALERVVYRDGTNEYLINGTKVRLRDIIEVLAGANIGASGHHIISQGEADRILSASIKERRDMIEEALGLKIYEYKKEESEKKLEKTRENITQVELLRKEVAPHLKFLAGQVEKVNRALEMRKDLESRYREYLKREDLYLTTTKEKLRQEKQEPERGLKALEGRLEKAKATLERSKGNDERGKAILSLEAELARARTEKERLLRDVSRLEGEIAAEKRVLLRQEKELGDNVVPLSEVEAISRSFEEKVKEAQRADDVGVLRGVLAEMLALLRSFIASKRTREAAAGESGDLSRLLDEKKKLEREQEEAAKNERELGETYGKLQREVAQASDEDRQAERELFEVMGKQTEFRALVSGIENREAALARDEEAFKAEMRKHQDVSRAGSEQKFKGGLADTSEKTTRLHTAHHLLLKALQTVLGDHVKQRGSNITQERLRIDFSHGEKMTKDQLAEVERIVNEKIGEELPVIRSTLPKEQAETLGAEHEFGAKYPDVVSVYSVGPSGATIENPQFKKAFSIEFCGGPHVSNTNEIGTDPSTTLRAKFTILKEEAVAAGIRRIKGVLQ